METRPPAAEGAVVILQLDSTTRIVGTPMCWELQALSVVKGRQRWRPYKYYATLGQAVSAAVMAEIRTAPVEGVVAVLEAVERIVAKYVAAIDGAGDEIRRRVAS